MGLTYEAKAPASAVIQSNQQFCTIPTQISPSPTSVPLRDRSHAMPFSLFFFLEHTEISGFTRDVGINPD